MLMNKIDIWWESLPFYKEWVISGRTRKFFRDNFGYLKDKTILEIGCGNGEGAKVIKKYFSPKKIIATDLDPYLVNLAKERVKGPSINFEKQDAAKLTYGDNYFNGVFSFKVIHHIPNWQDCLKEVYRVLKKGGKFFIIEDSLESFETFFGKFLRLVTSHPYDSLYKRSEFLRYLEKIGFKIVKTVPQSQYFVVIAEK